MHVQDLIDSDVWNDLPEDPDTAFALIVRMAQPEAARVFERLGGLAAERDDYTALRDAQYSYINSLLGLAKGFEVPFFATYEIPYAHNFEDGVFRGFQADLSHFTAQVKGRTVRRNQQLSVRFSDRSADSVRSYLHHLKIAVENADLSEAKRKDLQDRLIQFEVALNGKRRLNILEVTILAMEIMAIPGGIWASGEVGSALAHKLIQAVADEKAEEVERAAVQISAAKPLAITAPTRPVATKRESYDIFDDIPF